MDRTLASTVLVMLALAGCEGAPVAAHRATTDGGATRVDAAPRGDASNAPVDAAREICSAVEQSAVDVHLPVDVIVLPDESSSMGAARAAVVAAMQGPFMRVMEAAGIDYHVIWTGNSALPVLEATGRVTRVPYGLGSGDMFGPLVSHYDLWRGALRPGSVKVFVQFTDARSGDGHAVAGYGASFDQVLAMIDPATFGTGPGHYTFTFDTFIGLTPNVPATQPYAATDAIVSGSCSSHYENSRALQQLAIVSGGLRFPLCDTGHFDGVFQAIADSAVTRATVPCELALPPPPADTVFDPTTLAVRYRSGGGASTVLRQVASAADCDASSFTFDGTTVSLCADACAVVEADSMATLSVLTGCNPVLY